MNQYTTKQQVHKYIIISLDIYIYIYLDRLNGCVSGFFPSIVCIHFCVCFYVLYQIFINTNYTVCSCEFDVHLYFMRSNERFRDSWLNTDNIITYIDNNNMNISHKTCTLCVNEIFNVDDNNDDDHEDAKNHTLKLAEDDFFSVFISHIHGD